MWEELEKLKVLQYRKKNIYSFLGIKTWKIKILKIKNVIVTCIKGYLFPGHFSCISSAY